MDIGSGSHRKSVLVTIPNQKIVLDQKSDQRMLKTVFSYVNTLSLETLQRVVWPQRGCAKTSQLIAISPNFVTISTEGDMGICMRTI